MAQHNQAFVPAFRIAGYEFVEGIGVLENRRSAPRVWETWNRNGNREIWQEWECWRISDREFHAVRPVKRHRFSFKICRIDPHRAYGARSKPVIRVTGVTDASNQEDKGH